MNVPVTNVLCRLRPTRPTLITMIATLLAASIFTSNTNGQVTRTWDDLSGGIFDISGNWTPNGIPGPVDTARFVELSTSSVPITFYEDEVVETLSLESGRYSFFGAANFGTGPKRLEVTNMLVSNAGHLLVRHGIDDRSFYLAVTGDCDIANSLVVAEGTAFTAMDVKLDSAIINSPGEVSVVGYGPNGETTTWDARDVTVGGARFGAVLANSGSALAFENIVLGGEVTSRGEMTVTGIGPNISAFTTGNIANLAIIGRRGQGDLEVSDGAVFSADDFWMATEAGSDGQVVLSGVANDLRGNLDVAGNLCVGGDDVQSGGTAEMMLLSHSRLDVGRTLKIWDNGLVEINSQSYLVCDEIENFDGGEFRFNAGTLQVNRFHGDLTHQGTLLPGGPETGSTFIFGNYIQEPGSKLILDVGGTTPGVTHDLVSLSGNAFLAGQIGIRLVNGFSPDPSDQFTVVVADDLIGFLFGVVNGQRMDTTEGTGSFVVNYGIGSAFDESRIVLTDYQPAGGVSVTPDSMVVIRGNLASGSEANLATSDNSDLSIRRSSSDVQSRTLFEVSATSPLLNPTDMSITLEGSVFARNFVTQVIQLYDFDNGSWSIVDSREARRLADMTIEVNLSGDVSRFVQPMTRQVKARVLYRSVNPRQQFSSYTDQFLWNIN